MFPSWCMLMSVRAVHDLMKADATCSYVAVHVQLIAHNYEVLSSNYWYPVDSLPSTPWNVGVPAAPWSPQRVP